MTHCAIVPFITVAHIHIKRTLTFSLILKMCTLVCVFFFHLYAPFCLKPNIVSSVPNTPGVYDLPFPSSVGQKWHQLLSPFSSREWCSVFSKSPHSCRKRQRLNLNTVHFLFMNICLSLRNVFVLILLLLSFLVRESELKVTNLKYTT